MACWRYLESIRYLREWSTHSTYISDTWRVLRTCVLQVHLIRDSLRYREYPQREALMRILGFSLYQYHMVGHIRPTSLLNLNARRLLKNGVKCTWILNLEYLGLICINAWLLRYCPYAFGMWHIQWSFGFIIKCVHFWRESLLIRLTNLSLNSTPHNFLKS